MVTGWKTKRLGDIAEICMCKRIFAEQTTVSGDIPFFKIGTFGKTPNAYISRSLFEKYKKEYSFPDKGDILLSAAGTLGKTVIYDGSPAYFQDSNIVWLKIDRKQITNEYLKQYYNVINWASPEGSTISRLYNGIIQATTVNLPPLSEQSAIATSLSDADSLIASLQKLIAKKKAIKQGAMQELLTGKRRLPGFSGEWKTKKIKEIAHVCSEKNAAHEKLNVLTCSKHFGFVDSLSYFKNQVFSKDTSGYKVIYKNQIGYPANHIEEGAIGLQNLYEKALVSPIYIVFSVTDSVDSFFLHRLLKLDSYKNIFATETCSSVDRRGSLRWPAFSEVEVSLPDIVEQREVAKVLSDMDTEIEKLEKKLSEYQKIKQGMMQELLTGRIRLINAEPKQEQQVTIAAKKHN